MEGQGSRKAGSRLGWTPAGCLAVTMTGPLFSPNRGVLGFQNWRRRQDEDSTAVDGAAAQLGEWPGSLGQRAPG